MIPQTIFRTNSRHYNTAFFIKEKTSNNVFHFEERPNPVLFVPSLKESFVEEVKKGREIVFEDFDDEGTLRSCEGLEYFIKVINIPVPTHVFDNHNHAFYFWCEALCQKKLEEKALLIHIDQHKDNRIPPDFLRKEESTDLDKVFAYTNSVLNVGNFIPAAQKIDLIQDIIFINSQASLENLNVKNLPEKNIILDIDLDFFAPEFDYIGNKFKLEVITKLIPKASVITVATSPFFIDQELAIKYLNEIFQCLTQYLKQYQDSQSPRFPFSKFFSPGKNSTNSMKRRPFFLQD